MPNWVWRALRVLVVVCLASTAAPARAAEVLRDEAGNVAAVVIAPRDASAARPITVYLHGMCGGPFNGCAALAPVVAAKSWLICPSATLHCDGGGLTWPARNFMPGIESAIERVKAAHGGAIDESRGRTLIGFSLGAFRGLELAQSGTAPYRRVLLIGGRIVPSARLLERAGVSRLLLAAGEYDMTHDHLQRAARRLATEGVAASFLSFGEIGHAFPPDLDERLLRALDWLAQSE